jgi:glycosidase
VIAPTSWPFAFHIASAVRDRYQFDASLFSLSGNVIFADIHAARTFAHKLNATRDLAAFPEQAIKPGDIIAMGLIDEILHYVAGRYRADVDATVMQRALERLSGEIGHGQLMDELRRFSEAFPPLAVYQGDIDADAYLAGTTAGLPNQAIALEELLLLWLANVNPAFSPFQELFDDAALAYEATYPRIINTLGQFFEEQPPFGPEQQSLVAMLRSPAIAVPHSLEGQLEYILAHWGYLLGERWYRVLAGLDVLQEERKLIFLGPGPARVYEFAGLEREGKHFSHDREWMPRLVLMAKNVYVWLDQLSRRYSRAITHLDEVPDEELDTLARWGFGGLWLIGIWERSRASRTIKQRCGNPEAVPSAYSLYDYVIAADLGGEVAYKRLQERAWRRGVRLASDMVPNHVGVYSRWMVEHPDWFVGLDHSPYPWYTFNGPDLSYDERVGVFIEDHYYTRSDAAVVFKRLDRGTGDERYIYHGNDGSSMPWNDTAQLNYLLPEVREAVIQIVLHVARQFPIIRFDAAMTLTKLHYQRLWFPEPGTGGAIPTRAEHGLSRDAFDARMPTEFWREVVDRVAAEAPDTLLVAEAFWLLEGFFVRTLGMHRVYNSAFMHMLRDEDNAGYRQVMKNTLEFDPEILKRFVNFMNNPDERTAVDQFGKEDKYFGICTLLATLPGLPMFGHGQLEGFAERYGMEYRRAYWDELPDRWLLERHEREVFPLLRRRELFAGVDQFLLYDCVDRDGVVNDDVIAYSNRLDEQRALVVYHNRFASAEGWMRTSVAYAATIGPGDERVLVQRALVDGLSLEVGEHVFWTFRDHGSGLEYLRSSIELRDQGLFVSLGAYQRHVFLDFRPVFDDERSHYASLAGYLNGRGVPSIAGALREVMLQSVQRRFEDLVNPALLRRLSVACVTAPEQQPDHALLDEVEQKLVALLLELQRQFGRGEDATHVAAYIRDRLTALLRLPALDAWGDATAHAQAEVGVVVLAVLEADERRWFTMLCWVFTCALGRAAGPDEDHRRSRSWIEDWLFGRVIGTALRDLDTGGDQAERVMQTVKLLVSHGDSMTRGVPGAARQLLERLVEDQDAGRFLQVNRFRDELWYSREAFEELLDWLMVTAAVATLAEHGAVPERALTPVANAVASIERLREAARQTGDQLDRLLNALHQ